MKSRVPGVFAFVLSSASLLAPRADMPKEITRPHSILAVGPIAQQAYLKAGNTDANDGFGSAVAVSGDTLVVGVPGESSNASGVNGDQVDNSAPGSGAVFVFVRDGAAWTQQAFMKASNSETADGFGAAVAISGDTLIVGAAGESSNASGVGGNQADNSLLYSGAAYVFIRNGTTWTQQAYLKASNAGEFNFFGSSVAASGNTLVIGAPAESSGAIGVNGNQEGYGAGNSGAAYVFTRNGTTWTQQAYLKASNTGVNDGFGSAVAISGETVVIGAAEEDSGATGVDGDQTNNGANSSGAAYVFSRNGTVWAQQAYLKASNADPYDGFGTSVAVSGNTLLVGARGEGSSAPGVNGDQTINSARGAGAAYVFVRSGATWIQQAYLKASNPAGAVPGYRSGDNFGMAVSVSGDAAVVGAFLESSNSFESGAAFVFTRSGTTWIQQAYLKASNYEFQDNFSRSVAISESTVAVGAPGKDLPATGVDGNPSDNSAQDAGAAYVYTGLGPEQSVIGNWRYAYFGAAAANVGNEEDFDHDGAANLLEFACGTDPANQASGLSSLKYSGTFAGNGTIVALGQPIAQLQVTMPTPEFRALFVRRKDFLATGLAYTPQFSVTLTNWQDNTATPSVLADDGNYQIVSVPFPALGGGENAEFFRMKISIAPGN